jgi:hypothetical protein
MRLATSAKPREHQEDAMWVVGRSQQHRLAARPFLTSRLPATTRQLRWRRWQERYQHWLIWTFVATREYRLLGGWALIHYRSKGALPVWSTHGPRVHQTRTHGMGVTYHPFPLPWKRDTWSPSS